MLKRFVSSTTNGLVNNFTIANLLTTMGLIADAWNNYMIYDGLRGFWPLLLVWFVAASDLDGFIARWRNAETKLGGILDPIRDKLFACSKFYFLARGFWEIKYAYPHLIPLIVVIYTFLALTEITLLIIGTYGLCKGYRVKPNKWGKSKMWWECVLICFIFSPLFFLFPQYLSHPLSLAILTIMPIRCLYLALKSIEGHWSEIELEKSKKNFILTYTRGKDDMAEEKEKVIDPVYCPIAGGLHKFTQNYGGSGGESCMACGYTKDAVPASEHLLQELEGKIPC